MPGPISRRENLSGEQLAAAKKRREGRVFALGGLPLFLSFFLRPNGPHTNMNQQNAFNYATEVLNRPLGHSTYYGHTPRNQKIMARATLQTLARNYGRTWTTHPSSNYYLRNNNNSKSANIPVNRPWNNFKNKDPISLNNRSNWKGNRAIEVNTNGRKTYFYPANFNTYFTNAWKNMSPTSNSSIHPTKRHPLNRSVVRRNQVKLVQFTGNQNKASER